MTGDDRVRHCSECSLKVYNLSEMTRKEAEDVLEKSEGRLCIRIYQRADGTVITRDCPVGTQALPYRVKRSVRMASATALALAAGLLGLSKTPAHSGTLVNEMQGGGDTTAVVDTAEVEMMIMGKMAYTPAEEDSTEAAIVQPVPDSTCGTTAPPEDPVDVHIIMGIMVMEPTIDTADAVVDSPVADTTDAPDVPSSMPDTSTDDSDIR